ncbi:MAG: LLM class flavin-dependent oxidoreductase [Bdellovibrio sp.]|nr:LLM class flavin-dependent oxidoreductase [Bdellovibrio sp.]
MKKLSEAKLSILDLASIAHGKTIADSFHNSVQLAQHAERLGFERFWLAEHHNLEGIASAATAVLIGHIAGHTSKIRVGSGGIMLPNHAPLTIAEQFGTLATLYPGRIDLGLGRAPGTDAPTMRALRRDMTGREAEFSDLVKELQYYFLPAQEGQKVRAIPGAGTDVPLWLLGSSLYSAQLAAELGLPFAFAGHFAPEMMMQAIDIYRVGFRPSKVLDKPYVMVGVQVLAADTQEKANLLATTVYQRFLGIIRNQRVSLQPPVQNMDAYWGPAERDLVLSRLRTSVIGDPAQVRLGMQKLVNATGADELIIVSDAFDPQDRLRSYEIIMEVSK